MILRARLARSNSVFSVIVFTTFPRFLPLDIW